MESTAPPEEGSETPRPRKIKRYANRKLYDTKDSKYVTLQQIATFVREGEDVRIIDNTTKEDLTNVTLAQIIYEEEKKGTESTTGASVGTLRNLIQQSGERLMTTLRGGPVGKLMTRKDEEGEVEAALQEAVAGKGTAEDGSPKRSVLMSPKEAIDELQRLADDQVRSLIGHAIGRVHTLQGEVGRLQARIEELEGKLIALQGAKSPEDDPENPADQSADA